MDTSVLISFLGASVLLTILPGPDFILVLTESITKGKKHGIPIALGLSLGVIIHTLLTTTGLSILVQKSNTIFTLIKILGAVYLFYLAYLSFHEKNQKIDFGNDFSEKKISFFKLLKRGFLANVLNPKVTLFFVALLPQFIDKNGTWNYTIQLLVLGFSFMVQSFLVFAIVTILAEKLANFITSEKFWNNIKWIKMMILIGLGVFLLVT